MAVLKTILQGESLTVGFTLPLSYELANIDSIKVYLGAKVYAHTITDNVVRCEIESDETALLYGKPKLVFWLDDSVFGVKKIDCGQIVIDTTSAQSHNESVNTGFDVMVMLSINESTISVDSVLYDYFKGDQGDNGYTPYIQSDYWYINGVNTGIKAVGNGIQSITLLSTVGLVKTYRILFTDATTFDYEVRDGAQGIQGIKGDKGDKGDTTDTTTYREDLSAQADGLVSSFTLGHSPMDLASCQVFLNGTERTIIQLVGNVITLDFAPVITADFVAVYRVNTTEIPNIENKVDKEIGKSLIEVVKITKLDGIETGAEVNVIEGVKRNGVLLTPTAKIVDITVPTTPSEVGAEPSFSKNTAFNKNFGSSAGTVTEGNDSRLSDARTPTAHAASHTNGTDDIQTATALIKGLLSAADWTTFNAKENAGTALSLVNQLINGASIGYDTLKEIEDKIIAINAIIGGSAPDGDAIVNTVAELLAVFSTFPEGSNMVTLLTAKLNTSDVYNALDYTLSGKALDARQGKALKDLIDGLTTAIGTKEDAITKSTGILSWSGSAWAWISSTISDGWSTASAWVATNGTNVVSHLTNTDLHLTQLAQNITGLKTFITGLITNHVEYNLTPTVPTAVGSQYYDATYKVLSTVLGNGVILQNGLEMYVNGVNKTGTPLVDKEVVYISTAQGNRPVFARAIATSEAASYVIGMISQTIADNGEGFCTVFGQVNGVDTSTYTDGAKLYISETIAGGLTTTRPIAPNHGVIIGIALNSTNSGAIFVHPADGYELSELHDVDITKSKTTPVDADALFLQDSADSSIWKKFTIANLKTFIDGLWAKLSGGNSFIGNQNVNGDISITEVLGSEEAPGLVVGTDWTTTTGWQTTSGILEHISNTTSLPSLTGTVPIVNSIYKVVFNVVNSPTSGTFVGNMTVTIGGILQATITSLGTYTLYVPAQAVTKIALNASVASSRFGIDSLSIKKVLNGMVDASGALAVGGVLYNQNMIPFAYISAVGNVAIPLALNVTGNTTLVTLNVTGNTTLGALTVGTITSSFSNTISRANGLNTVIQSFRGAVSTTATSALPAQNSLSFEQIASAWDTSAKSLIWGQYLQVIYNATTSKARQIFGYKYNSSTSNAIVEKFGMASNGDFSTKGDDILGAESLANTALTSGTSWAVTGDGVLASNVFTHTHSTGASTLTQLQASFATALVANRWYQLTYTITNSSFTGHAYVGTECSTDRVGLDTVATTAKVVLFKTNSAPTDFKIYVVSTVGTITLDNISLKECQSGNIESSGKFTGGGANGIKVKGDGVALFDGNIVIPKASTFGMLVDTASPTAPWRDIVGSVVPRAAAPNQATLQTYRGGQIRQWAFASGDRSDNIFHLPHDYVLGTDLHIHVHWSHNGTAISGNAVFNFYLSYAKGHNQAIFAAEKNVSITYNTTNIATTPQYQHRIDEVVISNAGGSATLIDRALFEPDGVILVNLDFTTIPTITGGSVNNPFLHSIDLHYQSSEIGTKQKAPNFYV